MKLLLLGSLLFIVLSAVTVSSQTYTTNFTATENPLSEGGKWTNGGAVGVDWQNVQTTTGSPNTAYSTGICNGYNDCIAILSGYPATQSAQATVFRQAGYTPPSTHEVELLLRFKVTSHSARGYEMDFWFGGSELEFVRWNGPIGDFTVLTSTGPGPGGLVTGDVIKAQITGSTITAYKNGNVIATCTDNTFSDGNPGMGFFVRPGGTLKNFCYSSFTATGNGTGDEGMLPASSGVLVSQGNPNPFHLSTTLRYSLETASDVRVRIYDQSGRMVRLLSGERMQPGSHAIAWDGRNQANEKLSSGVYFAKVELGNRSYSRKLLLAQ